MRKVIVWLLLVTLTATLFAGATMAYLMETDENVNVMTVGKVIIDQLEYERVGVETKDDNAVVQDFHDNKQLYPAVIDEGKFEWETNENYVPWDKIGKDGYTSGIWNPDEINNEVDKMVFLKNKGYYDAYVRTVFAFEAGKYETLNEFLSKVRLNINTTDWTWEWAQAPFAVPNADGTANTNYFIVTATYNKVLKPGEFTEISLSQIALDPSATNEDVKFFGDTYQVLVKSQAIQADGFGDELLPEYENAKTALVEGFGDLQNALPFENDTPFRGYDLPTALHNYEGDTTNVITKKVTKVVFDREEKYPEIMEDYKATLVDIGQDVNVHAYYVEAEDGTYTVYFLADGTIYAPENSANLFAGMTVLTEVDTTNFDVSRVTSMSRLFSGDTKLQTVDVSSWDISNVTTLNGAFMNCQSLQSLDVSDWDTSKVTDMYATFYYCRTLPSLDVSDWEVGNVTNMEFTFSGCEQFTTLDVADWDVSQVTSFDAFFQSARKNDSAMQLEYLDVSKWDISSCTNLNRMFFWCTKLETVDMSNWDTSKVTDLTSMFFNCKGLTTLYASEKWSTASFTHIDGAFSGCQKLVGGNGTSYAVARVTTAEYARIDTPEMPGYLTYKACN